MDNYSKQWINFHKGICSIDFFGSSNSRLMGVTGFRSENQIFTSDYIYKDQDCREVRIRFYEADGLMVFKELIFSYERFSEFIPQKNTLGNLGVGVINLPEQDLKGTVSLNFCGSCNPLIGTVAACIGYQYEHHNLSMKQAIISGHVINESNLSFIQFDGTVRPGFSGAPLLSIETGDVIGIVSNREMNEVKIYRDITGIVEQNLEQLSRVEGEWVVNDIDPIQVLIANQNQIKHLARQFFYNYTGKTGYALEINHVTEHFENNIDFDDH